MANKNYGLLKQGLGLVRALGDEFLQACERIEVPLEALHRLVTPKGRDTWDAIGRLITDHWRADQSGSHQGNHAGGHPFRGTRIGNPQNVIEVPDMAAVDLTAATEKELNLTYLDSDYAKWDFYRGVDGTPISGRGKRFEFLTLEPKRQVSSREVREYFQAKGFSGHAGAFTAWFKERMPQDHHASIPDDNGCWRRSNGRLCVPCSYFSDGNRLLDSCWLDGDDWDDRWVFVAFREL